MQHRERGAVAPAEFVETAPGMRAYFAAPAGGGPWPGVLIFQEAFGLNDYMQSEVRRLAEHGYAAIAPDLFDGQTFSYEDRESLAPRLQRLTDEGMMQHVRASVAFLAAQPEVKRSGYGTVGFCMGGRLSVLTAIELGSQIAAASSFYGGGIAPEEVRFFTPLRDRLPGVSAELLLVYGADDPSILPREHGTIVEALSAAKKTFALAVIAGAGHGFASTDRPSYNAAAAERGWADTLALFGRTLR